MPKYILIGLAVGVAVGAGLDEPGIGIAVGVGLGVALWAAWKDKAQATRSHPPLTPLHTAPMFAAEPLRSKHARRRR